MCWGAIIGDIVGSRFEFNNHLSKDFDLLTPDCHYTDDTVMTIAVMDALVRLMEADSRFTKEEVADRFAESYRDWYLKEPNQSYGLGFVKWLKDPCLPPYDSFGNGACMRVSPCAYFSDSRVTCFELARIATEVSHNHPIAVSWATWLSDTIFEIRHSTKINKKIDLRNRYEMIIPRFQWFTLDEIRHGYGFDETCQGTVPVAVEAVLEADSFEDALRNAVSVGGDTDTICAIAGSLAEPIFGIDKSLMRAAEKYLSPDILNTMASFLNSIR